MSDQTPDPTAWSDDQLDSLLDALAERAAERDDLDLPGSGASRRGVLAGLLGLGGAAAGAGVASAIGESESYGSSTGAVGTDTEPLTEANVQDLHAQQGQIDSVETGDLSIKPSNIPPVPNNGARIYSVDAVTVNSGQTKTVALADVSNVASVTGVLLLSQDSDGGVPESETLHFFITNGSVQETRILTGFSGRSYNQLSLSVSSGQLEAALTYDGGVGADVSVSLSTWVQGLSI